MPRGQRPLLLNGKSFHASNRRRVKEGILHADQDVRDAAANFFGKAFSSDPTVMPLVIQAIERCGFDDAFSTHSFLKNLVQTDETVSWLIRQAADGMGDAHPLNGITTI